MEVQFKKNVRVICDLEIDEEVVTGWFSNEERKVKVINLRFKPSTSSAFQIQIEGYNGWIDSDWVTKVSK